MNTLALTLMLSAASLLSSAPRAAAIADDSAYVTGGQFTATLDQSRNHWRLQPPVGGDVLVHTGACATGAMVPAGLWLLVLDSRGRPELVAPSVTPLPDGSPGRIALRPCDQASGDQLAVPKALLDLLVATTGAVYVRQ